MYWMDAKLRDAVLDVKNVLRAAIVYNVNLDSFSPPQFLNNLTLEQFVLAYLKKT